MAVLTSLSLDNFVILPTKKDLTFHDLCATIDKSLGVLGGNLGVAQLVARYLGVVEAASSSLVTQTKKALETLRFPMPFLYPVTQFLRGATQFATQVM